MTSPSTPARGALQPLPIGQLLACGAFIVTLSMGIRHGFGLWLQPITGAHDWSREQYAFAIALQNLVWGASGPLVGWWADRSGALKVLSTGALLYALGLVGMATSHSLLAFNLSTGVTLGLAQACTTYAVVYGVIGRHISAEKRSWAMGITAAAGSFGQFLMIPLASLLIERLGWSAALLALAASALLIAPLALGLRERHRSPADAPAPSPLNPALAPDSVSPKPTQPAALTPSPSPSPSPAPQGALAALSEAFSHRDYLLLTAGYFVCGFQVAFIGVHLPSYLRDQRMDPSLATTALALIGLFNVLGTYTAGVLGQRIKKNWILSGIYAARAVVMTLFLLSPLTPWSVSVFAAVMGFLWLSTVPPTNAVVAQMMGIKHLSMLGAVVFFSHQIGSFLGVWLAGRLYDATGSYQLVWWIAIALGVAAALINLPIREHQQPARRLLASTPARA